MSTLQKAIEENTAALRELTAALTGAHATIVPPAVSLAGGIQPCDMKPGKTTVAHAPAPEPAPEFTYDKDVKPFAIKLAARDKQAFLDLLAERGVKKGSDIPPQDLPEFLGRIKKVLGE